MTDAMILAKAEQWRHAATTARREQRERDGAVTPTMEIHCVTLEEAARQLEDMVARFPSETDKLQIFKQHLVNQTDFIVKTQADLGVAQGLAKQMDYRVRTTKIDAGWLIRREYP